MKKLRNRTESANVRHRAVSLSARVKSANKWREQLNPLRSLTLAQAVYMLESAQRGQFAGLQWTYSFIERRDAILKALIERRSAALMEMDWNVKIVAQDRYKGTFAPKLAEAQQDYLTAAYNKLQNLYEAIEHLALASFRGYAHIQIHDHSFELLDQWNFVRDGLYGDWVWNPDALDTSASNLPAENRLDPERDDLLIREVKSPINEIALIKFIRSSLSQKDWDAFVEIFGLPGCIVIMPGDVSPDKAADYQAAAEDVAEGASGSLPAGSDVKFASEHIGQSPFRDHLNYLNEQLVIAGTGGLLTMLTAPGSGTLAGSAHMEVFELLARSEARKLSELFQKQFDKRLLASEFPAAPVLAYFELAANEETSVKDIIDQVVLLAQAGYQTDVNELAEKTGYKLTIKPETQQMPGGQYLPGQADMFRNREPANAAGNETQSLRDPKPERLFAESAALNRNALLQVAAAMDEDLKPLRDRIAYALSIEDDEYFFNALRNLQAELPELLLQVNASPASATAIENSLAAALLNGIASKGGAK